MKKLSTIILLLFLFNLASQAQKTYSLENLEKASQEELDLYMDKALKLKKTGKTVTTVAAVTYGTLFLYGIIDPFDHGLDACLPAAYVSLPALAAVAVGVPMKITGKKRVKRINTIKNTAYDGIRFELSPCTQYNLVTQSYQPGLTLRIKF